MRSYPAMNIPTMRPKVLFKRTLHKQLYATATDATSLLFEKQWNAIVPFEHPNFGPPCTAEPLLLASAPRSSLSHC